MSALPPKADMSSRTFDVRYVPKADIRYVLFDLAIRSEPKCDGVPRVLQLGARPLTAFANAS